MTTLPTCSIHREYFYAAFSFFFLQLPVWASQHVWCSSSEVTCSSMCLFMSRKEIMVGSARELNVNAGERCTHTHTEPLQWRKRTVLLIPSPSPLLTFFSGLGNLTSPSVVSEHLYPFLVCWASLCIPWSDDEIISEISKEISLTAVSSDNKTVARQIL